MTLETILTDEIIDEYTKAGYWQNKVITDFLDEVVARTPDKVAAIDPRRQVTYAELAAEVDRAALGFLEMGIEPGDVISFQLPNWIEFLVVRFRRPPGSARCPIRSSRSTGTARSASW